MRRLLADRREMREVLDRLRGASEAADEGGMEGALRAAYAMGLHETGEMQARAAVQAARERYVALSGNRVALREALGNRSLSELETAVDEGSRLGAKCDEFKEGRGVVKHMRKVREQSEAALQRLDERDLKEALTMADRAGFELPTTETIRRMLKMPPRQLLKLRL